MDILWQDEKLGGMMELVLDDVGLWLKATSYSYRDSTEPTRVIYSSLDRKSALSLSDALRKAVGERYDNTD